MNNRSHLGRRGERAAVKFLRSLGYRILKRNYRSPHGEIDVIALDVETVVFAEVKTRSSAEAADPEINIHPEQQMRIRKATQYFLIESNAQHWPCRFDALSVLLPPRGRASVEHFVNVFQPARSKRADHSPWG